MKKSFKKTLKLFAVLCIAALTMILLCSCDLIDELKLQRIDSPNGDNLTLIYQGKEYKALTFKSDRYITMNRTERCYIVEPDVPLLLIDAFGRSANYDGELDLIESNYVYYAPDDKYDEYDKIMQRGKLDFYRLSYYDFDEDHNWCENYYVLDQKAVDLINGTKDNVVGKDRNSYGSARIEEIYLDSCDSKNVIYKSNTVTLYHDTVNNKYGLLLSDDQGVEIMKEFPESGFEIARSLFEKNNGRDYYGDVYVEEY